MATFTKDVEEIRQRAEKKIEDGAVTDSYKLDKDRAVEILNEALATEIVCVLRYQHHYFMATGVHGKSVAKVFKEHADEEREHTEELAERIQQLGGKPNFNPGDLVARSVSQYIEGESLGDMIREDLIAERMVIDVYQRMIEYFGVKDPTTRTLLEHIKGEEEEHASELSDFLFIVDPKTGEEKGEDPGAEPLRMEKRGESKGKSKPAAKPPVSASAQLREVEEDDTEEEELTASTAWGNEANVGNGEGGSPRKSLAPIESGWGNDSHSGTDEKRSKTRKPAASDDERKDSDKKKPGVNGRSKAERVAPKPERNTRSPKIVQKNRKSKRAA